MQLDAVARLVDELCARFDVPRQYPAPPFGYYGDELVHFEGVIGHAMVRGDKSDPAPDPRLWQTLPDVAGLRPTVDDAPPAAAASLGTVAPAPRSAGRESSRTVALSDSKPSRDFSREHRDTLFAANARRLNGMPVAAGSLVKTLLMELERRRVYLELATPLPGARAVEYEVVQGDPGDVARVAGALGFERVTDRRLEVRRA